MIDGEEKTERMRRARGMIGVPCVPWARAERGLEASSWAPRCNSKEDNVSQDNLFLVNVRTHSGSEVVSLILASNLREMAQSDSSPSCQEGAAEEAAEVFLRQPKLAGSKTTAQDSAGARWCSQTHTATTTAALACAGDLGPEIFLRSHSDKTDFPRIQSCH